MRSLQSRLRLAARVLPQRCAALVLGAVIACLLQACGLPRSGPMMSDINASRDSNDIVLVPVTADIARASRSPHRAVFPAAFTSEAPFDDERVASGDGIDVTVWERDGLGVFPAGPNGASALGELVVDRSGNIYLPYAGAVPAQGLTLPQLRGAILRRLTRLVTASDVVVQFTTRRGQTVTVQGDLQKPGVYPLGRNLSRLSDVLGLAAPDQANPEQMAILLRRNGTEATVRLADIYRNAANDIALRPGDSIIAHNIAEQIAVLGAAGVQGRVKLSKRDYTVLDALGDSRGLNDALANPRAVFLLRQPEPDAGADARPVVYRFDFTRPEQMVLAGSFVVHDGDAVLVSDAPFTQVVKVLSAFSATLGSARSLSTLGN